jgi:M6 family metalloprotease-like protein
VRQKCLLLILISIYLSFPIGKLFAVTAYPYPVKKVQPDGTNITIILQGDEKVKWAKSLDGYALAYNKNGIYEFANLNQSGDLVPSGVKARNISERTSDDFAFLATVPKDLHFSLSQVSIMKQVWGTLKSGGPERVFPTTGSRKLICMLIGFTDKAFTKTQADFQNLFNQVTYSTDGATGSVKDFFDESSYGKLDLTVDVAGPYTASNTMAYYGANDVNGNDLRPRELVAEAVQLANADVNFADYDNDNNGTVDGIYVIFAGYGEEAGGGANCIWSHAWNLATTLTLDGKTLSRYSCSPELRANSGTGLTRIGVICHEFGHVLGAPDFYDTNYSTGGQYSGTGYWDLQASGSWNGQTGAGETPAQPNPYTKIYVYNWATATLLSSQTTITLLEASHNSGSFYRFNTATANEYYLMENRQKVGFDVYIPGHGLLIYHVHSSIGSYSINATYPQMMYPVCANAGTEPGSTPASYGSINSGGCPFPGTGSKTQFTDATLPSQKSWAGALTNKSIINITEDIVAKTISLCFIACANAPESFTATSASKSQINLSWTINSLSSPVLIATSSSPSFGTPADATVYAEGDAIPGGGTVIYKGSLTSYIHSGLTPGTLHYYKAWSVLTGNAYSSGVMTSATTLCSTISVLPWNETFESSGLMPNCWSQVDHQGNGQVWEFGVMVGPVLTGNFAYLNSDAYGSGNTQNADLISPTLDLSSYSSVTLLFKHYFRSYSGSAGAVYYSIDNGSTWTSLSSFTSTSSSNPATFSETIAAVSGQPAVKFKWNYTGAWGFYWAIDDIQVVVTPPVAYAVTGSGSYCQGGAGLAVGVAGTQVGVIYTLLKNSIAQTPTIDGTGSAITFGNQLSGTYTVSGTNSGGTTTMTGSAVISVNPNLPVSVSIEASANPVCAGTQVTYTATPTNGGSAPAYQWKLNGTNAGTSSATYA